MFLVVASIQLSALLTEHITGGGQEGQVPPPKFGVGDANANAPLRFCHIGTIRSVLWPSKYAKIRFRRGLCPGPRWGSLQRSSKLPSQLGRGHPSPYLTPLGSDLPSALAMRPSEFQRDLRLCAHIHGSVCRASCLSSKLKLMKCHIITQPPTVMFKARPRCSECSL